MAKIGNMHIKRHTAGTSNEISLDVLDAARERMDAQKKRKGKKSFMLDFRPKPGAAKVETGKQPDGEATVGPEKTKSRGLHAGAPALDGNRARSQAVSIATGSPLIPADEVLRRKKDRRKSTVRKYALGIVAAGVAVAVLGFLGYRTYQAQQEFHGMFAHIVATAAAGDAYLVAIDEAMNDPLGATTDEERAVLRKEAVAVTSTADSTIEQAAGLAELTQADQDAVALDQLVEGARGRKNMVGLAMEAFSLADEASAARTAASAAWDMVISADATAREAVSKANAATTTAALEETTRELRQASNEFGAALMQLQSLESTVEGLDFSKQTDYLQKRIDTLEHAIATNEALAAGDRQAAAERNELYEAGDQDSADLARALPQSIDDVVVDAYKSGILSIQARYDKERERVSVADSRVRRYLGA